MKKSIRIGNAGGFWGDDLQAFRRQLLTGKLDYLTMDFLAEITMSILRKQQIRDPEAGYIGDFVDQVVENAELIEKSGTKILTNAGGINPLGCARKIISALKKQNRSLKLAVVDGDDLMAVIDQLYPGKADFKNMETGVSFEEIRQQIQSANAYMGIIPLLKALQTEANIIITGRVTDTSITMAPMVHELGWELNDWDKLASGLIAGHIIECGAQSTGGNFTDWKTIKTWTDFGYPIVEMYEDGSFDVIKADNSGGIISRDSVKEQIVYEMGDPSAYISPDVVADFTAIQISEKGKDRVRISEAKGYPPTHFLKISMAYKDGYSASGHVIISGPEAIIKAEKVREIFWDRLGISFEKQNTEFIGFNAAHLNLAASLEPNEILIRFSVYDREREKLEIFSKNIAPLILSGPPGMAVTGGRPRITQVLTYWPSLIHKKWINPRLIIPDDQGHIKEEYMLSSVTGFESGQDYSRSRVQEAKDPEAFNISGETENIRLADLCLARSGDKGDTANLGVLARSREIYEFLKEHLTAGIIKNMFRGHCRGKVIRYELDNLQALNFLLHEALDEGGTRSLRIDAQGKTFAQAFLNQRVPVPVSLSALVTQNLSKKG
ncbi:MAG: DUF1446 domain-containing protein [Cyclobacteriaceae bacterium]|nr:DUF1446 domain-containing protein [Cyclobacteriaceae bacterium]